MGIMGSSFLTITRTSRRMSLLNSSNRTIQKQNKWGRMREKRLFNFSIEKGTDKTGSKYYDHRIHHFPELSPEAKYWLLTHSCRVGGKVYEGRRNIPTGEEIRCHSIPKSILERDGERVYREEKPRHMR